MSTGVNLEMEKKMERVLIDIQTEISTLVNLKTANNAVMLFISIWKHKLNAMESGKMAKEFNGLVVQRPLIPSNLQSRDYHMSLSYILPNE